MIDLKVHKEATGAQMDVKVKRVQIIGMVTRFNTGSGTGKTGERHVKQMRQYGKDIHAKFDFACMCASMEV